MTLITPRKDEKVVDELGCWPTKTAVIREACLEKLEKHKKELEARKER